MSLLEEVKLLMEEFIKEETPPTPLLKDIEHLLWAIQFERDTAHHDK